jgi:hypothetical protein
VSVAATTTATDTATVAPPYALLTYQALASAELAELGSSTAAAHDGPSLRKTIKTSSNTPPATVDLGVWNCRIVEPSATTSAALPTTTTTTTSSEALLTKVLTKTVEDDDDDAKTPPSYCLTVDLRRPAAVEATLTALQNALVRHLVESHDACPAATTTTSTNSSSPDASPTHTTSVAMLRATQFGVASQDASYTAPTSAAVDDNSQPKIALMICATMMKPWTVEEQDDYATQQSRALLLYHLRKYAVALQATLVFCNGNDNDDNNNTVATTTALSPAQVAVLWRSWAQGTPVWESPAALLEEAGLPATTTTTSADDDNNDTHPLLYGPPDHYQSELVETVLVRAAQYPGHWDSTTDSLWTVWPSNSDAAPKGAVASQAAAAGDDWWLTELRASMDTATTTTAATTTPLRTPEPRSRARETPQKTPNNEASAFFASLLK